MDLRCKRCDASIPAADVNIEQMVAKCASCNAVFPVDEQLQERPPARLAVALPEGWTLLEDGGSLLEERGYRSAAGPAPGGLTLRWRWFKPSHVYTLVFALVWCAFLADWYGAATAGSAPWIVFVFPLIHVVVGVGLLYGSLAGLLNTTTLRIADGVLTIEHRPLPWLGARTIPVGEVAQLYCVAQEHRHKNSTSYSYTVRAQRSQGDEVVLVRKLSERSHALYIEQKIESALGIVDVAVVGELAK